MSLIQSRIRIRRGILWGRSLAIVGALFGIGGLLNVLLMPDRASVWSVGLAVYFLGMAAYGIFLWKTGRARLVDFEAENGRDAGRQTPV